MSHDGDVRNLTGWKNAYGKFKFESERLGRRRHQCRRELRLEFGDNCKSQSDKFQNYDNLCIRRRYISPSSLQRSRRLSIILQLLLEAYGGVFVKIKIKIKTIQHRCIVELYRSATVAHTGEGGALTCLTMQNLVSVNQTYNGSIPLMHVS